MDGSASQVARFAGLERAVLFTEKDPREDPVAGWAMEHATLGDDWEAGVEQAAEREREEVLGRLAGACVLAGRLLVAAALQVLRMPERGSVWDSWRDELGRVRLPRLREDDRLRLAAALEAQKGRLGGLTAGAVMLATVRQAVILRRFTTLGERLLAAQPDRCSPEFERVVVRHSRRVCDAVFADAGLGKALPPAVRCPVRAVVYLGEHPDPAAVREAVLAACELVVKRFGPGRASAAGLARLERALAPRSAEVITPAPIPDGPHSGSFFHWEDQDHAITEQPYKLLEVLWGRDQVQVRSVLQHCWDVDSQDEQFLKTALSLLNEVLLKFGVPFGYHKRRELVVRE